jgi:hypothetical protein
LPPGALRSGRHLPIFIGMNHGRQVLKTNSHKHQLISQNEAPRAFAGEKGIRDGNRISKHCECLSLPTRSPSPNSRASGPSNRTRVLGRPGLEATNACLILVVRHDTQTLPAALEIATGKVATHVRGSPDDKWTFSVSWTL